MRQVARLPKEKDVTTAPLPGTTLGERRCRACLAACLANMLVTCWSVVLEQHIASHLDPQAQLGS
jgi:hypothetical protein